MSDSEDFVPLYYIKTLSQLQFTYTPRVQNLLGFLDGSAIQVLEVLIRWLCHYRWHQACVTWRLAWSNSSPSLSLGWDGSGPSSESRQDVGGSPLTLTVKQPLWQHSSATAEPRGAYRDREQAKHSVAYRGCKRYSLSQQVLSLSTCQNFTGCSTRLSEYPPWIQIARLLKDHTRI